MTISLPYSYSDQQKNNRGQQLPHVSYISTPKKEQISPINYFRSNEPPRFPSQSNNKTRNLWTIKSSLSVNNQNTKKYRQTQFHCPI